MFDFLWDLSVINPLLLQHPTVTSCLLLVVCFQWIQSQLLCFLLPVGFISSGSSRSVRGVWRSHRRSPVQSGGGGWRRFRYEAFPPALLSCLICSSARERIFFLFSLPASEHQLKCQWIYHHQMTQQMEISFLLFTRLVLILSQPCDSVLEWVHAGSQLRWNKVGINYCCNSLESRGVFLARFGINISVRENPSDIERSVLFILYSFGLVNFMKNIHCSGLQKYSYPINLFACFSFSA